MKVFLFKVLTLVCIVAASFTATSCEKEEEEPRQVYYAYYEFSDDMLELFDVNISFINDDFDTLDSLHINEATPYKVNEKLGIKSYLLKCDATGKRLASFQCTTKIMEKGKALETDGRVYDLMFSYSIHKMLNDETEEEAIGTTIYSRKVFTYKNITGEELAAMTDDSSFGIRKIEKIKSELEESSNNVF